MSSRDANGASFFAIVNSISQHEVEIMRRIRLRCNSGVVLAVMLLVLTPSRVSTQEVTLVAPDVKEVAKGYRAEALEHKTVVNDKGENIGPIDDFIFGRDNEPVFAVLSVGDFV